MPDTPPDSSMATLPPELARSRPRDVALTVSGWVVGSLVLLMLLGAVAFPLLLMTLDAHQRAETASLRRDGRTIDAAIVRRWWSNKGNDRNVGYAFEVGGVTIEGHSTVPSSQWDRLQETQRIAVRYLPGNPAINHPAAWEPSLLGPWPPLALGLLSLAVGLVLGANMRRERQLLSDGRAVMGTVVSRRQAVGRRQPFRYQYQTDTGESVTRPWSSYQSHSVGDPIAVVFDPDRPTRAIPYPGSLYRLR